jgi:hypothetical protein
MKHALVEPVDMEFQFPVFVRMKDPGDVRKYSSVFEMQRELVNTRAAEGAPI